MALRASRRTIRSKATRWTKVGSDYCWSVTESVDVLRVLQCTACYDALVRIRDLIPSSLRGVQDLTPPKRDPSVKWCEKTLIDKGLPMSEYLKEAVELLPRSVTGKGMGPVLRAVVKAVAELGDGVIPWRAQQERGSGSTCMRGGCSCFADGSRRDQGSWW